MPRPEAGQPSTEPAAPLDTGVVRRRRVVVAATLVVGTAVLGGTLAAPSGSGLFYGLGLVAAVIWIAGGLLSGPIRWAPRGVKTVGPVDIGGPILLGAALFGVFFAAKLVADRVPLLSHSVGSVLARADAGPRILVLIVAIVNGMGEEIIFRGALFSALARHRVLWTTAIYCVVTVATLNAALVVAALVMGTVFSAERKASGGILAPVLTHLSWSTLVILFLPR